MVKINKKKLLKAIVFIIVFLGFSYFIFNVIDFESFLDRIGIFKYILIPFISVFGSNTITSSFLYPILFFLKETGINIFLLIILAAIGGVIGDLIFMFFGKKINENSDKRPMKKIFEFFRKKQNSPYLPILIFLYAGFFPMPNEAMTFVLGYLKYSTKKILLPLILGNILYYTLLIYVGGEIWSLIF